MKVVLSAEAFADVDQIVEFLRRENRQAARGFKEKFRELLKSIRSFPTLIPKTVRSEEGIELRMRIVPRYSNYVVFYTLKPQHIEIVRVLHGARDWQSILGADFPTEQENE